jgi:CubicO group peptidase (beta-lactamase class C family)
MMRWDRALRDGELISRESYREMYTPRMNDYGYGWFIRDRGGRRTISHSGGVPGFTSLFLRYPDDELSVVVLSNKTPVRPQVIALSLADIVLDGGR